MQVKPHVYLWVVALAALLSYGIVTYILSHPLDNRENNEETEALPPAYFFDQKGQKVTLDAFKGDVVLVNLWATWCLPCVAELPALDKLQAKLRKKNFKVVAIDMDRDGSLKTVTQFLDKKRLDHLAPYWDKERQVSGAWKYDAIPTSFLLDADGKVVQTFNGPYDWDKGDLFSKISGLTK